ncbi:HEAT repeat domain-containing protein [Paenibacillus filicis]|uniref:HEAT repeat domain-containing protein n=1 Tax=Paenibacillus gyeongsangnamensis TaxID=3388067 RepID=A0ABT4QEE2_9BACL|nr:HEAT repeat domain-containing protein [Paenibacillus filicis]MCZ8515247.1 HEAT repeat domain-containing protein [Paenibacillus filicis]
METQHLLTDEQVAHFITRGYLVLENDLPPGFHQSILENIAKVYAEEGNPGNNILPRIPQIEKCLTTPKVKGALTSLLGEDYYMHPHRHCHYNRPGQPTPQAWHKDGYWSPMRSHRPWWAIIFYYTQDVTEEMGPTGIMPGSQYYESYPGDDSEMRMPCGKAGTMVLVHFDLWHRASHNLSGIDRYMLKFQFVRLQAPVYPSWNHQKPELVLPEGVDTLHPHRVIWNDVWNWMRGREGAAPNSAASEAEPDAQVDAFIVQLGHEDSKVRTHAADRLGLLGGSARRAVGPLAKAIDDPAEPAALNAAYALARIGHEGIPSLLEVLRQGGEASAKRAAYGLAAAGEPAVPGLIQELDSENELRAGYAAFALGMMSYSARAAVPALIKQLEHRSPWVRRNAVEALGMIRQPSSVVVPALIRALEQDDTVEEGDTDAYVKSQKYIRHKIRYTAALSLLRVGQEQEARKAVPALSRALEDEDRYVRAYAAEALTHIRSDEAVQVMIDYFRKSRWCPSTHKASTF